MKKIVLFTTDEHKLFELNQIMAEYQEEIIIETGSLVDGVAKTRNLLSHGIEVVLAKGQTAIEIRDNFPSLTVIDVPITGFDLVNAFEKARTLGSQVAVIAFPAMISQIESLESALGVKIKKYNILSRDQINAAINDAIKDGANVLMGGYSARQVAEQRGIPYVQLVCGNQAYIEAFHNAKRIMASVHEEKRKAGLITAVLNHAYEGIVSVDENCRIIALNPVADQIIKFPSDAIGRNLNDLWADLNLDKVLVSGKEELNILYKINGKQILCNKVPIKDQRKAIGAVVTFQDITKIQMMEARIRKEIYSKGHLANFTFKDIYGSSAAICAAINEAKSYSLTDANVLITGETGVGKEVFAQSIHNNGKRDKGPFVAVNCAALPAQLLESELFGYVSGAFTGANKEGKPGLFEVAHTGTIFLDEIGEMDYINQGRLLRVLQERSVMRLGSDRVIPIDVRIIAATNKNLQQMVADNKFREDLYYRLNVLHLKIPSLRERKKDISLYFTQFLKNISPNKLKISKSVLKVLEAYSWPGNIRELRNIVERSAALSQRETINVAFISKILNLDNSISPDNQEAKEITTALASCNGRIGDVAKLMNISRSTLWRKMKRLGINA
ncbi:MAG: hypothetical protein H6Q72_3702 [Firmicutes bacterium]|nr:hypothetical protein [Bacillota bacterium]